MLGIGNWEDRHCHQVLLLSLHNCSPHVGHNEAAYQIFKYLSYHNNGAQIVFDSLRVKIK